MLKTTYAGTIRMTPTKTYDYLNRHANQPTRMAFSDGSYWGYTYEAKGQVTRGKRYWEDGRPLVGQQFENGFVGMDGNGNGPFEETIRGRGALAKSHPSCFSTKLTDNAI